MPGSGTFVPPLLLLLVLPDVEEVLPPEVEDVWPPLLEVEVVLHLLPLQPQPLLEPFPEAMAGAETASAPSAIAPTRAFLSMVFPPLLLDPNG